MGRTYFSNARPVLKLLDAQEFTRMVFMLHRGKPKIQTRPHGLRIVIPYWFGWPMFSFMVLWTAFNLHFLYSERFIRATSDPRLYLAWPFSVFGLGILLWLILGRETISFEEPFIKVTRGILGIGPADSFAMSDVQDLRVGSFLDRRAPGGNWDASFVHAGIYFEYNGKTRSFSTEIWEVDAARIVEAIHMHYPGIVYTLSDTPEEWSHP